MIPQYIYLALLLISLGISLAKHGEPKNERYNFFTALIGAVLAIALLAWGGFFDGFK